MAIAFILYPFRRGFFCDDESIQLPYFDSTVSTYALYGFGITIPVLLIFAGEYAFLEQQNARKLSILYDKHKSRLYYKAVFRKLICFASGWLYQYLIASVAKVTVGRLRPNFIAACGIDLDQVCRNKTNQYISHYTCPNGDDAADDSRVSFFSGHACFSFYAAVFTVLYLQKRLQFGTLIWKPLLQFCIILLATWVSLTRIMDNQHHMSDVLMGILVGSGIALINTIYVHSLLDEDVIVDSGTFSKTNESSVNVAVSETSSLLENESKE